MKRKTQKSDLFFAGNVDEEVAVPRLSQGKGWVALSTLYGAFPSPPSSLKNSY